MVDCRKGERLDWFGLDERDTKQQELKIIILITPLGLYKAYSIANSILIFFVINFSLPRISQLIVLFLAVLLVSTRSDL